ncbi:VRR-Nuc domain protein [Streptomyces phage Scap1]|uniref:Hydrolase n=1 Tax=Streptomyces phage Scap1 TaxID=2041354 RepID=A0A2D1GNR0_9CAUD|nr:endonuclease [Streptomyces phage Scap1]ATN93702.1 VRR-Nuc domain protein [Streptomyces phage Scap1]
MRESQYQARLIDELERRFPGCVVLKNDPEYHQGIPDLVIFYGDRWAMLEVKVSETARVQVNQPYWVETLNSMSFAAFIYPSNEEEVLRGLEQALTARGHTRLSERQ